MKRLTILAIIACIGLLFAPSAVISNAAGPPGGLEVKVLNTPLPVTGDVTGTISGEVEVTNDETNPLPVIIQNENVSAKQPLYINLGNMSLDETQPNFKVYRSTKPYEVPDGYRLVIEQVFLQMTVPTDTDGVSGTIHVSTSVSNGSYSDYLPFLFTDQGLDRNGDKILHASQSMKLYIQPTKEGDLKKTVSFCVRVEGGTLSGIYGDDPVLCGYLEELP